MFPIRGRLKDTIAAALILVVQCPAAVLTDVQPLIMVTDIGNFFPAVFTQEVFAFKDQLIPTAFTS
jgi:hypothetical protein